MQLREFQRCAERFLDGAAFLALVLSLGGGASRLCYHGVDRILPGSSTLLPEGGRINLTLRRVTLPPDR